MNDDRGQGVLQDEVHAFPRCSRIQWQIDRAATQDCQQACIQPQRLRQADRDQWRIIGRGQKWQQPLLNRQRLGMQLRVADAVSIQIQRSAPGMSLKALLQSFDNWGSAFLQQPRPLIQIEGMQVGQPVQPVQRMLTDVPHRADNRRLAQVVRVS